MEPFHQNNKAIANNGIKGTLKTKENKSLLPSEITRTQQQSH